MSLDVGSITNTMITGVRRAIGDRWTKVRVVAEPELHKLAQTMADVQQLYVDKKITADHAAQLIGMQRNTAMSVLRTVEGLGILTARAALDAAVQAAAGVVHRVIGSKLITGTPISQKSATSSPTGRTKEKTQERPVSPAKPASRPVKANFKAGKDL